MTTPTGAVAEPPAPTGPVATIVGATLAAGHDGLAEVLVAIRYPNGAERSTSLPYDAVDDALEAAGVATLDALVGRPWTVLTRPSSHAPADDRRPPLRTSPPPNEPGAT